MQYDYVFVSFRPTAHEKTIYGSRSGYIHTQNIGFFNTHLKKKKNTPTLNAVSGV